MAGEWRQSTWGEEVSLEYGKALRGHDASHGRYRVYGSNGPIGWTDTPLVGGPGVVLGRKGAYRGAEYAAAPFFVIDTAYYVLPKSEMDLRWLYYAVKHHKLGEIDDGSPIPSTTRAAVYVRDLDIPSLVEQRAIAHILGTLDDKIELNRRMNETLEEMARALFKSWFVDFDPVRAKAEGRKPAGMDEETAKLFPSEFVESELGTIPKGWRVGRLGDVARQVSGSARPQDVPASTPYIGLEHMPRRSIALGDWGVADDAQSQKTRFQRGQLLFGKLRPYFHKVGVAPVDGLCSTDIVVLEPLRGPFFSFCLGHISSDAFVANTTAGSDGTKMPRTSWGRMADYDLVVPSESIAGAFDVVVRSLVDQIHSRIFESRLTVEVRDALLPQLLSGVVEVVGALA